MSDVLPEDRQHLLYYHCSHGSSNTPCPRHFPDGEVMPDNWYETYVSPGPPGVTDQATIG